MVMLRVGAGGWAYFRVPGKSSLGAYSSVFDFVEVNSTYYTYPNPRTVSRWRRTVPTDFEFSVRCHRSIVDAFATKGGRKIIEVLEKMEGVCKTLRANVFAILLPLDRLGRSEVEKGLSELLPAFDGSGTRVAIEFRGGNPGEGVLNVMKDMDAVHCVDLSTDQPAYESDVLYSRLFGKGQDNVYQFDDRELREIARRASAPKFERSILAFHGVRMYGDSARLKTFLKTGEFPMVTGQVGLDSLRTVLKEDTKFPASKAELVSLQGWKLFDLSRRKRARAGRPLSKLPEGTYQNLDSVISALRYRSALDVPGA